MHVYGIPSRWPAVLYFVAFASVVIGALAFLYSPGKNGFDSVPLYWLATLVTAPIVSFLCVATMWRRGAKAWVAFVCTFCLMPQLVVWYFAVRGILYYLGLLW